MKEQILSFCIFPLGESVLRKVHVEMPYAGASQWSSHSSGCVKSLCILMELSFVCHQ